MASSKVILTATTSTTNPDLPCQPPPICSSFSSILADLQNQHEENPGNPPSLSNPQSLGSMKMEDLLKNIYVTPPPEPVSFCTRGESMTREGSSRERKQAYTVELESPVTQLEEENARMVREEVEVPAHRGPMNLSSECEVSTSSRDDYDDDEMDEFQKNLLRALKKNTKLSKENRELKKWRISLEENIRTLEESKQDSQNLVQRFRGIIHDQEEEISTLSSKVTTLEKKNFGDKDKGMASSSSRPNPKEKSKATAPSSGKPNLDFESRLEKFKKKKLILERGISLTELRNTDVSRTVVQRQWTEYVAHPPNANADIVREFYASMVPDVFCMGGSVRVRGVDVSFSASDINKRFSTPDHDLYRGIGMLDMFDNNEGLAEALRMNGNSMWTFQSPLRHSELHFELAFWNIFFGNSLRPNLHRTETNLEVAKLLYCMKERCDINIGRYIHQEIYAAGNMKTPSLPFPCLITYFCSLAGIPVYNESEDILRPMGALNRKTYNELASPRGVETIPSSGSRKRHRGHQDDQGDAGDVPQGDAGDVLPGDQRPNWVEDIFTAIKGVSQSIGSLDTRFTSLQEEINQRMDGLQASMDHLSAAGPSD
ncbi:hypothetical protein Q3G72_006680 [Acer saccharum]|nr:hypothetical protein Q3G72_006680 [Acer saccharum]